MTEPNTRPRFVKIIVRDLGTGYVDYLDHVSLDDLFDGAEPGERFVFELVSMTQEEYDALPEFGGF